MAKVKRFSFLLLLTAFIILFGQQELFAAKRIEATLFYSPSCKNCIAVKDYFLPTIITKYKDTIELDMKYLSIAEEENLKSFIAVQEQFGVKAYVPTILIGGRLLASSSQIRKNLESILLKSSSPQVTIDKSHGDLLLVNKFKSFSPFAVVVAGLIDGINPCAFAVIIFFISFLTLMGYKRLDLAFIGLSFIIAVFLTYLGIGLGIFKGLYELKHFNMIMRFGYIFMAGLCFILAYINLKDFFVYRKTQNPELLKTKLPRPIRLRINSVISTFYRKNTRDASKSRAYLVVSAFVVGFFVSLLEAVCTGQIYVPIIVFILKEPSLRLQAMLYLLLYNIMFVVPLLLILLIALVGVHSNKIESFFREKLALTKLLMALLFMGLGMFLLVGLS